MQLKLGSFREWAFKIFTSVMSRTHLSHVMPLIVKTCQEKWESNEKKTQMLIPAPAPSVPPSPVPFLICQKAFAPNCYWGLIPPIWKQPSCSKLCAPLEPGIWGSERRTWQYFALYGLQLDCLSMARVMFHSFKINELYWDIWYVCEKHCSPHTWK